MPISSTFDRGFLTLMPLLDKKTWKGAGFFQLKSINFSERACLKTPWHTPPHDLVIGHSPRFVYS